MHAYLLAALWASVSYILYTLINRFVQDRRYAREAARLGCKPVRAMPSKLPFGIDRVREGIQADSAMQFPEYMTKRYLNFGETHQYKIIGNQGFMTVDPKNIQAILATQFQDFELGPMRRNNLMPLLGNGIFTADGKEWEHARAMMRPQFARDQVSDLKLEEVHLQNMMRALPTGAGGWTSSMDLQVLFFRLTLDSACEFLFGESVDSQIAALPTNAAAASAKDSTKDEKVFAKAFDLSQKYLATRVRLMDKHWLLNTAEFRRSCKETHAFVDYFVKLALNKEFKEEELEKGNVSVGTNRYVFLDALAAQTRDPIELRSQLLNILLAGRDTTASLLGWLFFILARNPDHYAKLRAAILRDFGPYSASPEESITYVSLKNCQYLQYCMNETLRLYAVVPFNSRRAVRDTTIPRGGGPDGQSKVFVRKGEQVDYSVHIMHRRKDLWGQDADEFRPERWAGRKPGWEYLPFNGGPRICLGQQFALTKASYVTVRLMQRFDKIVNCDPETVVRHNLTLTSSSGNGVKVQLHEAME